MVVENAVSNLKGRPKDERTAVAGGIAITVVVILLFAWGIYFIKKIQSGAASVNLDQGAQGEFNFSTVRDAQEQLQKTFQDSNAELEAIRAQAGSSNTGVQQNVDFQTSSGQETDPFTGGQQ